MDDIDLSIFAQFLPCVSDWQTLLIMADLAEERGHESLAKHLRWTSREWEWERGLRRDKCKDGLPVWARFSNQGWSRAVIDSVTPTHIYVVFPHRPRRFAGGYQRAARAWWDLEYRLKNPPTRLRRKGKPQPRKGYGAVKNAELAAFLTGTSMKLQPAKSAESETVANWDLVSFEELPLFAGTQP